MNKARKSKEVEQGRKALSVLDIHWRWHFTEVDNVLIYTENEYYFGDVHSFVLIYMLIYEL